MASKVFKKFVQQVHSEQTTSSALWTSSSHASHVVSHQQTARPCSRRQALDTLVKLVGPLAIGLEHSSLAAGRGSCNHQEVRCERQGGRCHNGFPGSLGTLVAVVVFAISGGLDLLL
eukprot:3964496-Amphidinium_carterae.1